jgi:hypothetical protein
VHGNCTFSITKSSQHVLQHGTLNASACRNVNGGSSGSLVGAKLEMEIEVVGTKITGRLGGKTVAVVQLWMMVSWRSRPGSLRWLGGGTARCSLTSV